MTKLQGSELRANPQALPKQLEASFSPFQTVLGKCFLRCIRLSWHMLNHTQPIRIPWHFANPLTVWPSGNASTTRERGFQAHLVKLADVNML